MRNEEQNKAAKEITAKEAGGAGYFEAIGTTLDDVLGRMKEIGNLEIQLKSTQETVVRLEGEWNELAAGVGEKVRKVVQSQYDQIMANIEDSMQKSNTKIGQYRKSAPQPKQVEQWAENVASLQKQDTEGPVAGEKQLTPWTEQQRSEGAAAERSKGFDASSTSGYGSASVPETATGALAQDVDARRNRDNPAIFDERFHQK